MTKNTWQLRRVAAWLAILALPLACANVGLALVAVDYDLTLFGDFDSGFRVIADRLDAPALLRWSMISDMLGFYLMLIPLAVVLWDWLRARNQPLVTLFTLFGVAYLLCGAIGAAILGVVLPY